MNCITPVAKKLNIFVAQFQMSLINNRNIISNLWCTTTMKEKRALSEQQGVVGPQMSPSNGQVSYHVWQEARRPSVI